MALQPRRRAVSRAVSPPEKSRLAALRRQPATARAPGPAPARSLYSVTIRLFDPRRQGWIQPRSRKETKAPSPTMTWSRMRMPTSSPTATEPSGELDVLGGGLGVAARVVVHADERAGRLAHGDAEDLARVHERRRSGCPSLTCSSRITRFFASSSTTRKRSFARRAGRGGSARRCRGSSGRRAARACAAAPRAGPARTPRPAAAALAGDSPPAARARPASRPRAARSVRKRSRRRHARGRAAARPAAGPRSDRQQIGASRGARAPRRCRSARHSGVARRGAASPAGATSERGSARAPTPPAGARGHARARAASGRRDRRRGRGDLGGRGRSLGVVASHVDHSREGGAPATEISRRGRAPRRPAGRRGAPVTRRRPGSRPRRPRAGRGASFARTMRLSMIAMIDDTHM